MIFLSWAHLGVGAQLFWGLDKLYAAKLVRRVRGMLPPNKFLNGAIWCILKQIFIIFYLKTILKIFIYYSKVMINCSHVLARGFRGMIHGYYF